MPRNQRTASKPSSAKIKKAPTPVEPLNQPLSDELMDELLASQKAERASELGQIGPVMSAKKKRSFEYALQNPEKLASHNKSKKGKNAKYPRMGLAERQASIMQTASKADPFMRALDAKGNLSDSHMQNPLEKYKKADYLRSGQSVGSDRTLRNGSGAKIHAIGMGEFKNKEGALPKLTGSKSKSTWGDESRQGKWSEADVNPVTITSQVHEDGYERVRTRNRGAERLLHTSKKSSALKPDGKGGTSSGKVDFSQYITNDHYHSMIPVSAVEEDYKANNPYTPKYMDPSGEKSSLELHEEREAARLEAEAKANAPVVEEPVVEESSAAVEETVAKAAPNATKPTLTDDERAEQALAETIRRNKQSAAAKRNNKRRGGGKKRRRRGRGKRR